MEHEIVEQFYASKQAMSVMAMKTMDKSLEMSGGIDEDYTRLLNAVTTIAHRCCIAAPNHTSRRISDITRRLLAQRRLTDRQRNHVEYTILCRLCRQKLTEDHRSFSRQ